MTKRFVLLCAALALVLSVGLIGWSGTAFADEDDDTSADTGNTVNVAQLPDSSFLHNVPISELASADSFHDEQTVLVEGEVVGDLIRDESESDHCWITLQESDGESTSVVSVFIKRDLTSMIDSWGHYGQKGTTLQVDGVFHLTCPDHQGASDIHATTAAVVSSGEAVEMEPSSLVFTLSWIFPLCGLVLLIYFRRRNEQER